MGVAYEKSIKIYFPKSVKLTFGGSFQCNEIKIVNTVELWHHLGEIICLPVYNIQQQNKKIGYHTFLAL